MSSLPATEESPFMNPTPLRHALLAIGALALATLAGADQKPANPNAIAWPELPAAAQKTILEKSKGATIQLILRTPAAYTARLDAGGQKSEVRVTADGRVLKIRSKREAEQQFEEEERLARAGRLNTVRLAEVPAAARNVIVERSRGMTLEQIVLAPATYTVQLDQAGEKSALRVTDDGKALE
jgi:uncharacterized membrane-anchored protein